MQKILDSHRALHVRLGILIEFRKCCEALLKNALFTITSIEINGLFNSIDVDQSNEVSYREFLQELRNCDPLRQKSMQAKALAGPTMEEQQAIPVWQCDNQI